MDATSDSGAAPITKDDLRRLESRLGAQLQEMAARLVLHDGRFAAMTDRHNQTDRRRDALRAWIEARLGAVDRRFDELEARSDRLDARIADWRVEVTDLASANRRAMYRSTMLGALITVLVSGALLGLGYFVIVRPGLL